MKANLKQRLSKLQERVDQIHLARAKDSTRLVISLPCDVDDAGKRALISAAELEHEGKELIVINTIGKLHPEKRRLLDGENYRIHQ